MNIILKVTELQYLKSLAQKIKPVTIIGHKGLTEAVKQEIATNLNAHELIKVQVAMDERSDREAIFEELCNKLSAAKVQHIGKQLVLWRPTEKSRIIFPVT